MRLIFIILFFYCSNILSSEENKIKKLDSFFNKKPAEQREIFINKFRKIILKKNTSVEKSSESIITQIGNIKTVESLLIESLESISNGKLDQAIKTIDELIVLAPNFKLAHLIRGDILTAYSMSIDDFGGSATKINSIKVEEFKKEAQRRIKGYLASIKYNLHF